MKFLLETTRDSLTKSKEQLREKEESTEKFVKDKDVVIFPFQIDINQAFLKQLDSMQKQIEQLKFNLEMKDEQIDKLKVKISNESLLLYLLN